MIGVEAGCDELELARTSPKWTQRTRNPNGRQNIPKQLGIKSSSERNRNVAKVE
jgi:hypothetical protein